MFWAQIHFYVMSFAQRTANIYIAVLFEDHFLHLKKTGSSCSYISIWHFSSISIHETDNQDDLH